MKGINLSKARSFVAREWLPSVISLFLAVALWYNVGGEQTVDTSVMIPVEVLNLPRELVISNQFKKEIEVTVRGGSATDGTDYTNTVTVTIPATIIPIAIAAFAAYGFAWIDFKGRKPLFIATVALLAWRRR